MTCQAYPESGIITLLWMGLFHTFGVSSFYCRSFLRQQERAVFYLIIIFLFPLTFEAVNMFK